MNDYEHTAFTLPTIDIVGGETESLTFNIYTSTHEPADLVSGTECGFAIAPYVAQNATPLITKTCTIQAGSSGANNVVITSLSSSDTVNLYGKYIYQLTIKFGNRAEPYQGIMYIARNIHLGYLA